MTPDLITEDLAAWFREDVSRWNALSPGAKKKLAKHSPFYVTPAPPPKLPRGGKRRGSGGPKGLRLSKQKQYKSILSSLKRGWKIKTVARRFGVSVSRIYQVVARARKAPT